MRILKPVAIIGAVAAWSSLAVAQQAQTTRIETRPVYGGAVVSVEHGVRVYRPVPPTKNVIINPNGQSPLALIIDGMRGAMGR